MTESEPLQSRVGSLESALNEVRGELAAQKDHNQRLISTLRDAREQIVTLKAEVDRLGEPPSGFATFLVQYGDGTADVMASGKKLRVALSPAIDADALRPGQEVMLNESLNVIDVRSFEDTGEIVVFKEFIGEDRDRALVIGRAVVERQDDEFADGPPDATAAVLVLDQARQQGCQALPLVHVAFVLGERAPILFCTPFGSLFERDLAARG